jgi:hypothetical protein
MEKESSGQRPVEVNNTGDQGSCRAVAPSDDDEHITSHTSGGYCHAHFSG